MGRFLEFAELLEDKIRREIHLQEGYFPSENDLAQSKTENSNFDNSPLGMAWLLGELERKATVSTKGKSAYGVTARPPRPRKPHVLNVEQTLAFEFFRRETPELNPGFTLREVKMAYRKSAMVHHPDRGGYAENFRTLSASYLVLQQIFGA